MAAPRWCEFGREAARCLLPRHQWQGAYRAHRTRDASTATVGAAMGAFTKFPSLLSTGRARKSLQLLGGVSKQYDRPATVEEK